MQGGGGRKTVFLKKPETYCFQGTAWLRSRRFLFHEFVQGDKAQPVILDVDALPPLAAGLVRGLHIDRLNQFPKGVGVKRLNGRILLRRLDELLRACLKTFDKK